MRKSNSSCCPLVMRASMSAIRASRLSSTWSCAGFPFCPSVGNCALLHLEKQAVVLVQCLVEALVLSVTDDTVGGTGASSEVKPNGKNQEQRRRTGVSALHELCGLAGPTLFRRTLGMT